MTSPQNPPPPQQWDWPPPPPTPSSDVGPGKIALIAIGIIAGAVILISGFFLGFGYALAFTATDDLYPAAPLDDPSASAGGRTGGSLEQPDETPEETPDETPEEVGAIGETSTYDDGLEVTVTALEERQPIEINTNADILFGDDKMVVIATVEVTNGTEDPLARRNGLTLVAGLYGPDEIAAHRVFDATELPDVSEVIPPGGTVTAKYGFAVPPSKTDEFRINIIPTIWHGASTWSGSTKEPAGPTA